ncbi:hypothetical protein [Tsukamurella tyrosinosolvens]|uniref:hypothetical protein n=1 Tax=Tsukamurella tyrosinosolvens TaxID=57704 RepID=UPI003F49B6F3
MSLEYVEEQIESIRAQAARMSADYSYTQEQVASDPNLSEIGKREQLAPLHEELTGKLAALRQQEKAVVKSKRESLERSIFGLPAGITNDPARLIGFRDAQDRAARLDNAEDAQAAYESAVLSDDTVLARAILARSLNRGWDRVANDYLERNPQSRTELTDLKNLQRFEENSSMSALVHYMAPSRTAQPMPSPSTRPGNLAPVITGFQ